MSCEKCARVRLLVIVLMGLGSLKGVSDSIQDVKHVVILMQENRSFDHYYGVMRGVRGFNDPNILLSQSGASDLFQYYGTNFYLPFQTTNLCINDVDHGEETGLAAWNGGWWNEWIPAKGQESMAFYARTNLPFYYALADAYTICDANYCSFFGPTFPNRIYLFTGTIDPAGTGGGPCLDNTIPTNGFTWTTYPERLQAAGISWRVYRPNGDWFGDALQWFAQYKNATNGNPLYDRGMAAVNDVIAAFSADVTNGTLPQVSWIVPTDLSWSEHPPYSVERGENFVQRALAALEANPAVYDSTVFILTYDENGGFYDHLAPPAAPPGTPGEFAGGERLGPAVRVPMIIVSPWSRGGRVCSQVFDHTSIIRFLEAWTGVQEPNISAWRRLVCGDLTSALDFSRPDFSLPSLPPASPADYPGVTAVPPATQSVPDQESGSRPACPLPYQPDAWCRTDDVSNRLFVTMTNAGTASAHFSVFPNAYRFDPPWQYDVAPASSLGDSYVQPIPAKGMYDFTCYGPNGFQRRFAGNLGLDNSRIEIASLINPALGSINLTLLNSGTNAVGFTVADNLNSNAVWAPSVPAGSSTNQAFFAVANNSGWYDLTVTSDADTNFLRHLAGHVENGAFSFSQLPVIVGNILVASTNNPGTGIGPTNPPPPVVSSINDVVRILISQYSLATAGTNSLALMIGGYGTNCALIYPGWASNFVVQTSAGLMPPAWTPLNTAVGVVSNCNVVILPATGSGQYFRLSQ